MSEHSGTHAGVLVVGGGVAAVELVLALEDTLAGACGVTLLAPEGYCRYRPLAAYAGLVPDVPEPVDLADLVARHGAGLVLDRMTAVDPGTRVVRTAHGGRISYDALVVATGGVAEATVRGAITLGRRDDESRLHRLIDEVRAGERDRIAVVAPPNARWTLPAYELALLLRATAPHDPSIAVITAEPVAMGLFGETASAAVQALLARHDVQVAAATFPDFYDGTHLWMPWQGAVEVDAVIALSTPRGPALPGLAHDRAGFLRVDPRGRVHGNPGVWAAGDVTDRLLKQGGLAVEDADIVAQDVAHLLGFAPEPPAPTSRVLRATLLDGEAALHLRAEGRPDGDRWAEAVVSHEPLWWPAGKIAGGRLARVLARTATHGR